MKALIIDDEPLARRELRQLLATHAMFSAIADAAGVEEAIRLTRTFSPDVVFLDVQLRGETGFDYLDRLGSMPAHVVIVTAHENYAIKAFDCAAVDYLLKPVDPTRLAATVRRLFSGPNAAPSASPETPAGDTAVLKLGSQLRLVPWRDIRRISTEGNYTRVYLRDGTSHLILRTLKDWQTLLPSADYVQTHRSSLVRRADIAEVRQAGHGDRELVLSDATAVPVGRLFWADLKRTLGL